MFHISKKNELLLKTQIKFLPLSSHAIVPRMSMIIVVNDMSLLHLGLKGENPAHAA